jgi:hypothetical protein
MRHSKAEFRSQRREWAQCGLSEHSALAGFEAALRLIDDVNAALPAHDPVVAVPTAKRFQ